MKIWAVILILLSFVCTSFAEELPAKRYSGYPQGTFKKSWNGKIIQYDKTGKKVGVYKINTKRYKR